VNAKPQAAEEKDDRIEVTGRVIDPHTKPVAGAKVFFARSALIFRDPLPVPATVTSDADGRFRLRVSRTGYQTDDEQGYWLRGAVVAVGQGYAPGWVGGDNVEKLRDLTIKLAREHPIAGRVVDLQGKPIAGVRVHAQRVSFREDGGDLKGLVKALKSHTYSDFPGTRVDPALLGLTQPAVTGPDGKFRLTGIGSECAVGLRIEGPTIETVEVYVLTHADPTIRFPLTALHYIFYGARFDHAAAPTRAVVGVVRDKDTGKPIAGVTIRARVRSFVGLPSGISVPPPRPTELTASSACITTGGISLNSYLLPGSPTCRPCGRFRPRAAANL
jgi:hypothetical protein